MSEEIEQIPVSTVFQRFRLLLWKSYLWHRFYWWWSILEIIIRCVIPLYLGLQVPNDIKLESHPVAYAIPQSRIELLNTTISFDYLVYVPSTSFTDKLMNNVVETLKLELRNAAQIELVKMHTEKDLEEYTLNRSITLKQFPMAIVFLELASENTTPNKLIYKLRHGRKIDTNSLLSKFSTVGEHEFESDYWTDGFSAIQLLVNEEFVRMKSDNASWAAPESIFQAFPYPEYETSEIRRQELLLFFCSAIVCIEMALSVPYIASVIAEKRSGAKELMKVYGVEESLIWLNWFVIEFLIILISVTLATIFLKIPFKGHASQSVRRVEFSVLWTFFMLFSTSNVTLTLFICSIFNRATTAALVYVFLNFLSVILVYVTNFLNLRRASLLFCVIPSANILKSVGFMLDAENHGFVYDWSAVKSVRHNEASIKASVHFFIFLFDIFVYFFLALYIGSRNRDRFTTGLQKLFIFQSFYRRIRNKEPVAAESSPKVSLSETSKTSLKTSESLVMAPESPTSKTDDDDDSYFAPINPELTIQIEDLSTDYGSVHGLNRLNIEFYDHEVGVVLGHNGAGKSSLLGVLAGILSYDRGSIHYKGSDVTDDPDILKSHVGICFRENRLFNYVSVLNHLIFYGMLKGLSKSSATDEAEHYLLKMEMQNDEKSKISSLSESTKRKLSIANSFMGDRQVLLLDEPMIGLDSDARTATWNFLMGLRFDHTIIITSNYEKDAERLADRITVLENGEVVAHGTPKSLRKNIGIRYEIAVAGKNTDFAAVTETMRRNVQVPAQQEATAEIIYEVPISEASKFVNLFRNLENDDLKISEINVTSNSIEHALMKLRNSSTNHSFKSPNTLEILVSGHDSSHHVPANDFLMKLRQIKILFQKRVHYVMRDRKNILCRIILPTFIALLFLVIMEHLNVDPFVPMKMSPSTYINPSIMLSPISWSHQMNEFVANYMNSEHVSFLVSAENSKMIENLVDFGRKDVMRFRRELIAAFEFGANKSHHIWYNLWVLHSLPIAITTYSNILLRHITKDESLEIITFNHPIAVANIECRTNELWSHVFIVLMILFIMFGYFTIEIVLYLFELSSKEIANGLMHLQIMSGVPPWIYWFATIVFDLLFFIIVVVVRIALFTLLDNYHKFFTYDFNFGVFSLLVFIFGTTGLMYAYIISFLYKPTNRTYAHLFEFNFLCHLIVAMSYLLFPSPGDIEETQRRYSLLTYVFMWFPFLNFPWAVARYLKQWLKNNECSLTCSSRLKSWCGTVHTASKSALEFSTYENPNGILLELTFLAISLIISAVIFILMNFGFVDLVHNYFKSKEPPYRNYDEDVKHERIEIHHIKEESRHFQIPLLVDGLSKNYIKRLKPITCVEDVSFIANHGTCFGILRGYEAGKTTVFDMMTAKTIPTRGNVSVEGVEMRTNKREYFSKIGYCPRMSPVLDKFTGKEMLLLIASLNGSRSDPENLVSEWISASGLDELQHVKCEDYTDGSKRLLSTVLALLGHPKVVFLDEPTSEIDSQTRRHLYDIIEQVKYSHRTVVFGSTSAIECYLLCDRLTILKNGAMHCLGHPHDLRKHYDLGFFIVIKVQSDIMSMREVRYLEDHMIRVFGSKAAHLIEHYRGLLHYQIADTKLRVSVIFKRMEEIKESNSIIEEYFVRTTTLEDIFDFFSH